MVKALLFVRRLGLVSTVSVLLVFAIYWFELDDKFLKAFEPIFRKISDWSKG
jgi:hypothetical protein